MAVERDSSRSSWPGLSRPSTACFGSTKKDVDARHKSLHSGAAEGGDPGAGHDEIGTVRIKRRWYEMRLITIAAAAGVAAVTLAARAPVAHAQSCFDLWVERNSIYKRAGYCFKTARAIRYFGNAGCEYDDQADVPLSPGQRARVARIVRLERDLGCRD